MGSNGGIDDLTLSRVYGQLREQCSCSRARGILAEAGLESLLVEADRIIGAGTKDTTIDPESTINRLASELRMVDWNREKKQLSVHQRTLIHACFYLTAAAVVESEAMEGGEAFISLHQQLLPALVRLWTGLMRSEPSWFFLANRSIYDWPRNLWTIVTEYFGTEEPHLMSRSLMVLSVAIRIYFPLKDEPEEVSGGSAGAGAAEGGAVAGTFSYLQTGSID